MTAAMPLTIDPDTVKVIVGANGANPSPGLPRWDHRPDSSAVRRAWNRTKAAVGRLANRQARQAGRTAIPDPERESDCGERADATRRDWLRWPAGSPLDMGL